MGRKITVSGAKTKVHEEAEKEAPANEKANSELPPVAPKSPVKEEVHSLVEDTEKKEEVSAQTTEAVSEEEKA